MVMRNVSNRSCDHVDLISSVETASISCHVDNDADIDPEGHHDIHTPILREWPRGDQQAAAFKKVWLLKDPMIFKGFPVAVRSNLSAVSKSDDTQLSSHRLRQAA